MFYSLSTLRLKSGDPIKNVKGTGKEKPKGGGTWKQKYIEDGDKWPPRCRIRFCDNPADGGGHVYVNGQPGNVYIVPMCNTVHNTAQNMDWLPAKHSTIALFIRKETSIRNSRDSRTEYSDYDNALVTPGNKTEKPADVGIWIPRTRPMESKTKKPADVGIWIPRPMECETRSRKLTNFNVCIIVIIIIIIIIIIVIIIKLF